MNAPRRRVQQGVVAALVLALLAGVVSSALGGVLLPWSPLSVGFERHGLTRGVVLAPPNTPRVSEYLALDTLVEELEAFHGLRFTKPVTVIVTRSWKQFNRGTLLGLDDMPREVLGAALQTGDAIYLSPLMAEPGRRPRAVLKHELAHALLYQHTGLWKSFALHEVRWLLEGLAVHAGNADDYLSGREFRVMAAEHPEYLFRPSGHSSVDRMPRELGGVFMLSEYRFFIEFLRDRHGDARRRAFIRTVADDPTNVPAAFVRTYGVSLESAEDAFMRCVRDGRCPA